MVNPAGSAGSADRLEVPPAEVVSGPDPLAALDANPAEVGSPAELFDAFYARELPRLVALAQALCGRAAADDIAQEAMFAAYRRWGEVSTYVSPEAWVRRVCANHATSLLRRRAAQARAILRLAGRPAADEPALEHEDFWDELRRLPRRQAQAAALRYVDDLSIADIAMTLGCSEGAVKAHLSRARAALAQRLEQAAEDKS